MFVDKWHIVNKYLRELGISGKEICDFDVCRQVAQCEKTPRDLNICSQVKRGF